MRRTIIATLATAALASTASASPLPPTQFILTGDIIIPGSICICSGGGITEGDQFLPFTETFSIGAKGAILPPATFLGQLVDSQWIALPPLAIGAWWRFDALRVQAGVPKGSTWLSTVLPIAVLGGEADFSAGSYPLTGQITLATAPPPIAATPLPGSLALFGAVAALGGLVLRRAGSGAQGENASVAAG